MPNAKNDVQDMSINDPQQNISVKITFYFNISKQSILDFFENYPYYLPTDFLGVYRLLFRHVYGFFLLSLGNPGSG